MALNPFFLQGSSKEQFLIQDLINEQLKIYGIDVYYLPRKFLKTDDILGEVQSSKFDDNFIIEAYLDNYEGYAPGSDLMTKFGLRLKNEINLIISQERFDEFITPFLEGISSAIEDGDITDQTIPLTTRPREGDLIYFPLGERLFEIKRVESEKPFYQLGKTYVYELLCELYEYENEDIDVSVEEIDNLLQDEGYITTLTLEPVGVSASASASVGGVGLVGKISLIDDGYNYSSTPSVTISSPTSGTRATAVAITTSIGGIKSVKEIRITNAGSGYTSSDPPTVTITGGGGVGAAATALIVDNAVQVLTIDNAGTGYFIAPTITIDPPTGVGAAATATVSSAGTVTAATVSTGGGYFNPNTPPEVTFSTPLDRINGVTGIIPAGLLPQGTGFTSGVYNTTNVSVGSTGTGLTLDVSVNESGNVTAATIADPGQYYESADTVRITNGLSGIGSTVSFYVTTASNIDGEVATGIASVSSAGIVTSISITYGGVGYYTGATVSIANTEGNKVYGTGLIRATAVATVNSSGNITSLSMTNAGLGYTSIPSVSITGISTTGIGTYQIGETITGSLSGTTAEIKNIKLRTDISVNNPPIELYVGINDGQFSAGEVITGSDSLATYILKSYDNNSYEESYDRNEEFETEADLILDFTETNPFGEY